MIIFPGGSAGKTPVYQRRRHKRCRLDPWLGKIPWSRKWQPTPVFLPGESHRQKSLVDYSPRSHTESDTTEQLTHTHTHTHTHTLIIFPGGSAGKESACNAGDPGLIPGLGRSPGAGNGNPLQYSCLENPMDREARWAIVHGVAKSRT